MSAPSTYRSSTQPWLPLAATQKEVLPTLCSRLQQHEGRPCLSAAPITSHLGQMGRCSSTTAPPAPSSLERRCRPPAASAPNHLEGSHHSSAAPAPAAWGGRHNSAAAPLLPATCRQALPTSRPHPQQPGRNTLLSCSPYPYQPQPPPSGQGIP
jgi:hypothetical protein